MGSEMCIRDSITPLQIAGTVSSILGGKEATTLKIDGEEVSVNVEYPPEQYDTIDELQGIVLTTNNGTSVALTDVADIVFKDSPAAIVRKNRQYQVTITGELTTDEPRQVNAIETRLYQDVVEKHMGPNITRATNAMDEAMLEEFGNLGGAIALSLIHISEPTRP